MRLVALLAFFDDQPELLHRAVSSAVHAGATHLVAVDGPYENFPHARVRSPSACYRAIVSGARSASVRFWTPWAAWEGDEVAKREFMLRLALERTGPADWMMVLDSDYEWEADSSLAHELSFTECQVATVAYTESNGATWSPARMLFRADPQLRMGENHYTYLHPSGGRSDILCRASTEPAADLQSLARVYHHNDQRPESRARDQAAYYDVRDTQGLES